MIIKEVIISNYQCYYGDKRFDFVKGSNIILGKNGGGKTKFYEALEWLLSSNNKDLDELISKKKLNEAIIGSAFKVGVEITFLQGELMNTVKKYFSVQKKDGKDYIKTNVVYEGIIENEKGERVVIDGQALLVQLFPSRNRKYCMFKGESELNILKNTDALANLINLYAKVKHYGPYAEKGTLFRGYADKAIEETVKKDRKNEKRYKELEIEINDLYNKLREKEIFLQAKYEEKKRLDENIQGVEKHLENAESVETIKKRIADIDEQIKKKDALINEEYTTSLFDKSWLLINFERIQQIFSEKITFISEEKRRLQKAFDVEIGIREGERRAQAALFKDVVPLPRDTPSKAVMEEMLKDEICKVCNREAKKGSEPYEFMLTRLNEYLSTQNPNTEETEKEELFKNNYITKLVNLEAAIDNNLVKVRSIKQTISDQLEFNQLRKNEITILNEKKDKEISDLENVIGNSELGQESLSQAYKNYKGWQRDITFVDKSIEELKSSIATLTNALTIKREEKEKIDKSTVSNFLTNTRKILRDIEKIFIETKENKYNEFVEQLQANANYFLKKINSGAFTGYIEIERKKTSINETVEVRLMQDGEEFYHPNTALQTSMHLAILFAIAKMTKDEKEECYPMIFDAPTSSFDPLRRKQFFEVLGECNEQTILLTKDFTDADPNNRLLYSEDFMNIKRDKAILIKLEEPFDEEILSTISTQVINL